MLFAVLHLTVSYHTVVVHWPEWTFPIQLHTIETEIILSDNRTKPWIYLYIIEMIYSVHVAVAIAHRAFNLNQIIIRVVVVRGSCHLSFHTYLTETTVRLIIFIVWTRFVI